MTSSESTMIKMRPVGPRITRVRPLPRGMRTFIFCLAVFSSVFATTSNSLMMGQASWPVVLFIAYRLPAPG